MQRSAMTCSIFLTSQATSSSLQQLQQQHHALHTQACCGTQALQATASIAPQMQQQRLAHQRYRHCESTWRALLQATALAGESTVPASAVVAAAGRLQALAVLLPLQRATPQLPASAAALAVVGVCHSHQALCTAVVQCAAQ